MAPVRIWWTRMAELQVADLADVKDGPLADWMLNQRLISGAPR